MNASRDTSLMIDVTAAREIAIAQVTPVRAVQDVPLHAALGQTCARDVTATSAMPFFTNSAMDGFALRHADLAGPGSVLPITGTVAAGDAGTSLPPGAALRIFTGAPLPLGADTVVALEDASDSGRAVRIDMIPDMGANLRLSAATSRLAPAWSPAARGSRRSMSAFLPRTGSPASPSPANRGLSSCRPAMNLPPPAFPGPRARSTMPTVPCCWHWRRWSAAPISP